MREVASVRGTVDWLPTSPATEELILHVDDFRGYWETYRKRPGGNATAELGQLETKLVTFYVEPVAEGAAVAQQVDISVEVVYHGSTRPTFSDASCGSGNV